MQCWRGKSSFSQSQALPVVRVSFKALRGSCRSGKGGGSAPQSHFFKLETQLFQAKPCLPAKPSVKYCGNVRSKQHIYPFRANDGFVSKQAPVLP